MAAYAGERGGLTLAFWKLNVGPAFGEPVMMRADRCAEELGVPHSDLQRIYRETWEWVRPRLDADPDYQKLRRELPEYQRLRPPRPPSP